jgi:hypothetical protein
MAEAGPLLERLAARLAAVHLGTGLLGNDHFSTDPLSGD